MGLLARRLLLVALGCGCTTIGDGTSLSVGSPAQGVLRGGVELPAIGDGYVVPPTWRARGRAYGTEELVEALVRVARAVQRELPGGTLGVADLSQRGGGRQVKHRSHGNGRDVDILYYAIDDAGRPLPPADAMVRYGSDLVSAPFQPEPGEPLPAPGWEPTVRRLDAARTWLLVRGLLTDPSIEVQWIFVAEHVRARLLEEAQRRGESPELVDRAVFLLRRPNDSAPHDDHMHVRILCDPGDRAYGCVDRGPTRWWKKHYKYMEPAFARAERAPMPELLKRLAVGPGWLLASALHGR